MSFSATHIDKKRSKWIRDEENGAERRKLRVKKPEDFQNDRKKSYKAKSRELSEPTSGRLAPIPSPLPTAVPTRNASLASVPPGNVQERGYRRPLPGEVAYSPYLVSAVSNTRSPPITNANPTTSSRTPSVAHSTHSTPAASVVSAAKSHAGTVSATQPSVSGNYHPHPPQTVPIPSLGTNNPHASSAVSTSPSTPPKNPLLLPAPKERSRASSEVSVTPSTASGKYPALLASSDSSRSSSVISAVQSRVPESHPSLPEPRVRNYRAPSVKSVASSTVSVQHPPLSVSRVPSEVQNPQPSRSQSVVSAARTAVRQDRLLLPASRSRSPSVAPSDVSFVEESSEYLQESHSRDPSRASSSRALALRAPSPQPLASRAASVTLSIRSEHAVSIPSAARRRVDEEYAKSVVSCSLSEVESSARSRRPRDVLPGERYTSSVSEGAPSVAANTRSTIKSGRSERDSSIASRSRSHIDENDYESNMQLVSSSKRASSIKSGRTERGISSASKARSHIDVNDPESSSERAPTSRRASSKASSSQSSRQASRDDRGRSTTSRTKGSYDESAGVRVSYDEHEEARPESQSRSVRSRSVSRYRSDSVSSIETVRPNEHNAMIAYRDNALHTAEASKDNTRRRSSRRKKSSTMSVVSVSTAAGLPVMRPDPSDSEAEQASGKKCQRSQQDRQQQQQQQRERQQQCYHPQPYGQPYTPQCPPQYPQYSQPYQQQYYPQPQATSFAYVNPAEDPRYASQPYLDPQYTHPQPTAPPYYPATNEPYPSQYMTSAPQPAPYSNLAREWEERKQGWHYPKGWDEAHERAPQPVGKRRRKAKYRDADL